jgi:hypothetical protein
MKRPIALGLMAAASFGTAAVALAQTPTTSATNEVAVTRSLNAEVAQRLLEADRKEAADAAAYREAQARYEAEVARYNAQSAQVAQTLEVRRENIDHEQELYNRRMADWRATVAACEAGDAVRCASGKAPAQPTPPRSH